MTYISHYYVALQNKLLKKQKTTFEFLFGVKLFDKIRS
jgi:hypothetical protein